MKIVVVSDLHVDINRTPLPDMEGEVLVVAGDTSNSAKIDAEAINELAKNFQHVVCVDGNHTHYNNNYYKTGKIDTIANNNKFLRSLLADNVVLLDSNHFLMNNEYMFIGCNGWYSMSYLGFTPEENIPFWQNYMNDYRYIYEKGSRNQPFPHILAERDANIVRTLVETAIQFGLKPIVVTHTVPHADMLDHRPWDPTWERASGFYLNSYMQDVLSDYGDKIALWCHGHTHYRKDKVINGCRVVCNPRGYPGENSNWEPLEIEL